MGECARGRSGGGVWRFDFGAGGRAEAGLAGGGFVCVISILGVGVGGVSERVRSRVVSFVRG